MNRILAIDDEETCLEIINFSLSTRGYEVHCVPSGLEAIDLLKNGDTKFDLILLDMMMPHISGLETLEQIRKIDGAKNIPVIFQTGTSEYASLVNNRDKDAFIYVIRKPYKREDLVKAVGQAIEEQRIKETVALAE
jgi:CheY-like chemotaxis protein